MAFETLAVRAASAVVLAPLFLGVLYTGGPALALLLALLAMAGMREFCAMARAASHSPSEPLAMAGAVAIFAAAFLGGFQATAIAMTLFPLALLLPYLRTEEYSKATVDSGLTLLGVVQYAYFFSFVYLIREHPQMGFPALLGLIILVWVQDTGAYMVGSAIGRTPLTPISPKKTWEGTGGGFVLAVTAAMLTLQYGFGRPVGILSVALLGVVGILAQLGDLSESLLKRNFGVKDSGHTIPGHGGVLDRFDSLCYSAPAMYVLYPWI